MNVFLPLEEEHHRSEYAYQFSHRYPHMEWWRKHQDLVLLQWEEDLVERSQLFHIPEKKMQECNFTKLEINTQWSIWKMQLQKSQLTWTTLTTKQRENGKVTKIKSNEKTTRRWAQIPWPSSQAMKHRITDHKFKEWSYQSSPLFHCFGLVPSCLPWFCCFSSTFHSSPGAESPKNIFNKIEIELN